MFEDWLTPDWPAPPQVRAVCTTRAGGVSNAPYDSLNLGDHVGDDPAHVVANRAIFQQTIGARPVFLNQVHGQVVLPLDAVAAASSTLAQTSPPVADAAITRTSGIACTVMVADCLPVLFATSRGDCVAAAHAGWRGLVGQGGVGVLEQTFKHFCAIAQIDKGQSATDIIAWLGPCIGPQAFEVGAEVCSAFVAGDSSAATHFTPVDSGQWLADLAGLARQRLVALGVKRIYGNDSSAPWCTVGNASRFFSHRRDRVSGRFAASIWLDG